MVQRLTHFPISNKTNIGLLEDNKQIRFVEHLRVFKNKHFVKSDVAEHMHMKDGSDRRNLHTQ
jgi:hypothetical protein